MTQFVKKRIFPKSLALAIVAALAMVTGVSAAEPTTTELDSKIDKEVNRLDDRIDNVKTQYTTAVKDGDNAVRDAFKAADKTLDDRITNVKDTLSKNATDGDNKVRNEFKAADTTINDRITKVRDILEDADKAISDRVTAAENSAASAHNRIDSVKEQYQEAIKTGDEAVRAEFERANTNTNNRIDSVKEQYKEAIATSDKAVRDAFARADTQLDNRITNVRDTLRNEYNSEFSTLQDVLGSGYNNPNFNALAAQSLTMGGHTITATNDGFNMGGARLSGIADGGIYRGSTDAVTGNQLWNAYQRMDDLQESINVVGAHAAALSGLHPIDYNPYEPTTLSAAIGTYRDEYAVAVGVFHYAKENVMFNLGASLCSDGDLMGRAGVSFTVGKSSDKPKVAGTMNGLRNQVIAMQAKLDELEEQNARNEDIIRQNMELIRELKAELDAKR